MFSVKSETQNQLKIQQYKCQRIVYAWITIDLFHHETPDSQRSEPVAT